MIRKPVFSSLSLVALPDIPLIKQGDDLANEMLNAVKRAELEVADGDIFILAQKVVSKAEGREILLRDIEPGAEASELALETGKDPRVVELILRESEKIVRKSRGTIISRSRLGFVQAHAGIDQSNVDHSDGEKVLLLPADPDASAKGLQQRVLSETGRRVGIMVIDSMNRPWRLGSVGMAIGCAGIKVLDDRIGEEDLFGRRMQVKTMNRADNLAAAANLLMGETTEACPIVLVRGIPFEETEQNAKAIIRPLDQDMFQ